MLTELRRSRPLSRSQPQAKKVTYELNTPGVTQQADKQTSSKICTDSQPGTLPPAYATLTQLRKTRVAAGGSLTDVFTNADAHLCECVAADIKRQYEHNSSTRWVTCGPDGLTIPHARP